MSIAERKLLLKDSTSATSQEISVQIGFPYWVIPEVEAACSVAIRGLDRTYRDIRGCDFIQAIELALKFMESEIQNLNTEQKTVCWPDGEKY